MWKRSLESSLSERRSVDRDIININFVKINSSTSLRLLTSSGKNRFLVSIVSVSTRAPGLKDTSYSKYMIYVTLVQTIGVLTHLFK